MTAKRKTYILELNENLERVAINVPTFETPSLKNTELHSKTGFLGSETKVHRPDWEALGKPKKIRVTVSAAE